MGTRLTAARALAIYGPVALVLLFTLFPVYWLVNSSLKTSGELFTFPPRYWPRDASLANYVDAMTRTRLGTLYLNSLWVSSLTCVALMGLIVFAGYAIARYRLRLHQRVERADPGRGADQQAGR